MKKLQRSLPSAAAAASIPPNHPLFCPSQGTQQLKITCFEMELLISHVMSQQLSSIASYSRRSVASPSPSQVTLRMTVVHVLVISCCVV